MLFDRSDKFTLDSAGRTEASDDVRQIVFDSSRTEVDGQLHYIEDQALVIVRDITNLQSQITDNDTDIANLQGRLQTVSELPNTTTGTVGDLVSLTATDTSSGLQPGIYRRIANNGNDNDWTSDSLNNAFAIVSNTNAITDNRNRSESNQITNLQTDARQDGQIDATQRQLATLANSLGTTSFTAQSPTITLNSDREITRESWEAATDTLGGVTTVVNSIGTVSTTQNIGLVSSVTPNLLSPELLNELNNLRQAGDATIPFDVGDIVTIVPTDTTRGTAGQNAEYYTQTAALPHLIPLGQRVDMYLPGAVDADGNISPVNITNIFTTGFTPTDAERTAGGFSLAQFTTHLANFINSITELNGLYTLTPLIISGGRGQITFVRTDTVNLRQYNTDNIRLTYLHWVDDPANTYASLNPQSPTGNNLFLLHDGHPPTAGDTSEVSFEDASGNDLFGGQLPVFQVLTVSGNTSAPVSSAMWINDNIGTANYFYNEGTTNPLREYRLNVL